MRSKRSEAKSGGTLFLALLLACGGGGPSDPTESEAEAESEAEGEDGNESEAEGDNPGEGEAESEAESIGDCNTYSFAGTWRGTLWQTDCVEGPETLEQCCLCCRSEAARRYRGVTLFRVLRDGHARHAPRQLRTPPVIQYLDSLGPWL